MKVVRRLLCSGLVGGGQIFPRVLLITVESSGLLLSDGRVSGGVDRAERLVKDCVAAWSAVGTTVAVFGPFGPKTLIFGPFLFFLGPGPMTFGPLHNLGLFS